MRLKMALNEYLVLSEEMAQSILGLEPNRTRRNSHPTCASRLSVGTKHSTVQQENLSRKTCSLNSLSVSSGDETVSQAGFTEKFKTYVVVESSGKCTWSSPATFKSLCNMDITNFPFDSQTCDVTFGSWTYDDRLMSMQQMDAKYDQAGMKQTLSNQDYSDK
ncbi:hypothetical protein QZH41_012842 [Actinostola sp. cb2023]|nr:hypothetical protein QZH41_012842 [Actinostola sp. cb2023]